MRITSKVLGVGVILFILMAVSAGANAQAIDLTLPGMKVRAAAVADTIFRISVNAAGEPAPRQSIYLDPDHPLTPIGRAETAGNVVSITTSAGVLRFDKTAGTYTLLDAKGAMLIPPTPIATIDGPALRLNIGWPVGQPFEVYDSGNGVDTLIQHAVNTRVDNGVAVQPFFWSLGGFATFVVGDDDNAPATCDGKIDTDHVSWRVHGSAADLYLIVAPTLDAATRGLLDLTGHPPVPPRWTFGYLQSRWGWKDRAYIDDTLHQFITRKIPVDAFIFDFEWYTTFPDYNVKPQGVAGFSDFGWNPALFPEPAEQVKQLHDAGVHFVGIRKPRLGNSDTLKFIRDKGWGFRSKSNVDTRGLWFADVDARTWYAQQLKPLLQVGIDGWWDDEGEFTYTNYIYWNMAERQALDAVNPKQRLWTIDRAFEPGSTRTGAVAWTGDINASWHDFGKTPASLMNWGLAGMPFCGCDIGGFNGQTTPQLLTRWTEAGTFFPIMRTHSELNMKPHFPWLFGDDAEAAMRKAIDLRMQLVPMLYSLAHQTHRTGEPMMRPLMTAFPNDVGVRNETSEWLIGDGLLAAPILTESDHRQVYFPADTWYDLATGEKHLGPTSIDVKAGFDQALAYVRAGTILPLGPVIQHTRDLPGGPLEVRIYPGRDARFTLTEDDGATTGYLHGDLRDTTFVWNDAARELTWSRSGTYAGPDVFTNVRVILEGEASSKPIEQTLAETGRVSFAR